MQALRELISRVRAWRVWYLLRRQRVAPVRATTLPDGEVLPILREVSRHGVRVYSLCGSCGAQLAASATLCDACAATRSRSAPNG